MAGKEKNKMSREEILEQLSETLMNFVKETATKNKRETSVSELNAMTEASKTLVEIARIKISN
jgi:hypothetical protein